ncbi:IS91 family transposase [Geoalkalibacter sp.]|uniref:IS91 family transposase n=1 Tax=Geoalkalibacter sp. TaxID=3041440 RepID=UPI00272E3147|nr:IS91 family transposase [Geoalkalibacter sp.]
MVELAEIIGRHGEAYRQRFAEGLLPSHRRTLADITACRTPVLGGRLFACNDCGHQHYAYHSCNNRSCPKCSGARSGRWLAQREAELLPIRYFHVVFTLPEPWREVVRSHQKQMLPLLMRAAAQALLTMGADPRYLGGELGLLCVLHTWTRTLIYHPHVHCLVPAGALSADGTWRPARKKFLLPVRALSRLFRGKFLHGVRQLLPRDQRPAYSEQEWVVYCKPTMNRTRKVLTYLGRYVHRVAITNRRILKLENGQVTFRWQERVTGKSRSMTLPAEEFLRRFLQHVLPKGLHKVRYYGWLRPARRVRLKQLQLLLARPERKREQTTNAKTVTAEPACPCCFTGMLVFVGRIQRGARSPPPPRLAPNGRQTGAGT